MTEKLGMLQYWRNNVKSENDTKRFSIIYNHNIKKIHIIHINKNSYTIFVFTVNAYVTKRIKGKYSFPDKFLRRNNFLKKFLTLITFYIFLFNKYS